MTDNIRLLEERVSQAVNRLRLLSAERQALETELRALQDRLESTDGGSDARKAAEWIALRERAVGLIRQTLEEIREH